MRKKILFVFIFLLFLIISVGCTNTSTFKNPNYELMSITSKEELKKLVKQPEIPWWQWWRNSSLKGVDIAAPNAENSIDDNSAGGTNTETSKTNVQVEGVDEADIVKNDDRYIYIANYYGVSIVDTVLEKVYYQKVENFSPSELFLYNDYLVVLGTELNNIVYQKQSKPRLDVAVDFGRCFYYHSQFFKVMVFNVADKENISVVREFSLKDGYYMQGRMIENTLYLMLNSYSVYDYEKDDVILPSFTDTTLHKAVQSLPLSRIKIIGDESYYNSYTVLASFEVDKETETKVDAYLGYFNTIYSSKENLYLTKQIYSYVDSPEVNSRSSGYDTVIYRFNYQNNKMVYQDKAFISGRIHNQFSLDEYTGVLRVAHTVENYNFNSNFYSESFVSTFDISKENKITLLASIGGMGINEQIYSARFSGVYGYVVTFRTIDPLYVVDLSDPTNPIVRSELKSPGVSDYLHNVNDNLLLGIGRAIDINQYGNAITKGVKISLFDVTDRDKTEEVDLLLIDGEYSYTELQYNHKALLTLPSRQIYALPVNFYLQNRYQQGMYVFKVNEETMKLSFVGLIQHDMLLNDYYLNYQQTIVRGVIIDGKIYTISQANVGINLLDDNLTLIKNLPLA